MRNNVSDGKANDDSDVSMADANISQGENMLIDTSTGSVSNAAAQHEIVSVFLAQLVSNQTHLF